MLINACRMGIDVIIGKQSVLFDTPVYVEQYASVVGKKEGEGPLADFFDEIIEDAMLGMNTWEEAGRKITGKGCKPFVRKITNIKG